MIRAVFLDFYNTLARFDPPREQRQVQVCSEFGIELSEDALRRAYPQADEYLYQQTAMNPAEKRSEADRIILFAEYERSILHEAGVEVSSTLALQIWERLRQLPTKFHLYEDALPSIQLLKQKGLILGIISNITKNSIRLFKELGLETELDFIITSVDVPPGKPHPTIFIKALEQAHTTANQTIHIGDQYHIDVVGARNVGIRPLLLDRNGFYSEIKDCQRIRGLHEIEAYL